MAFLPKINILLVDDDKNNLQMLSNTLSDKSYHLILATSGEQALQWLFKDQECAVIVLDIMMPEMDGFETAKLIRGHKRTQHTPIIFLTAHYQEPEYFAQGYQLKAIDYLIKPIHPQIFKTKIEILVDLYWKTSQLEITNQQLRQEVQRRQQVEKVLQLSNETLRQNLQIHHWLEQDYLKHHEKYQNQLQDYEYILKETKRATELETILRQNKIKMLKKNLIQTARKLEPLITLEQASIVNQITDLVTKITESK